ncbi:MAG: alpha/beta hydrolase fold domain-containing protein [bacterium]
MPTGSSRRGLAGSGHAVSARQRYAIGSGTAYHEFGVRMAGAADCRVLLLDYRLAPEHPFPAAVDDAVAAYRYLLEESARPGRVVIAGDSAGGGLALATLARLQDEGEALPTLVSASRPGPIWRPPVIPIAPGQWTIRWFGSMGCGEWRGYMPRTTCAIRWHHRYLPTSRVFRPFTWRSEFAEALLDERQQQVGGRKDLLQRCLEEVVVYGYAGAAHGAAAAARGRAATGLPAGGAAQPRGL